MEEPVVYQPQSDIVPVLIDLCAKPAQDDPDGHKALTNALFSILESSVATHPSITTHWLVAVHKALPQIRPVSVQSLMSRALRNCVKENPEQAMILSAEILNQTENGTQLSRISRAAFCRAFDAAMRKDRLAAHVPFIASEAAKAVFDERSDALKAYIRSGTIKAQIKLQP